MPQPPINLNSGLGDALPSSDPGGHYGYPAEISETPELAGGNGPRTGDGSTLDVPEATGTFHSPALLIDLDQAAKHSPSFPALIQNIAKSLNQASECLGLWGWEKTPQGDFGAPVSLLRMDDASENALWETLEPDAEALVQYSVQSKTLVSQQLPIGTDVLLVTCAIEGGHQPSQGLTNGMSLVGCFSTQTQTALRIEWMFGLANQAVTRWVQANSIKQVETHAQSMKDAFSVIHALNETDSIHAATKIVANHLQRMIKADQVVIALGENPSQLKLDALSGVERIEHQVEANRPMLAACQQAMLADTPLTFLGQTTQSIEELSLENYCNAVHSSGAIAMPLQGLTSGDGKYFGAILIAVGDRKLEEPHLQDYVQQLVTMLSGHLEVVIRANQSLRGVLKRRLARLGNHSLKKPIFAILGIAIGLLCIPMPYRVHCDCELQPIHRRFIAAPYEGILESSKVERGDLVTKDQLLARLDGQQLRMELSALRAELEGSNKRRESSLANGEIAESQIAKSEMRRHQSKINILEQQLKHLEVRSPIEGIVVVGDLEKAHGAPVEMGQTLFEVAPLDQMVAEIGIPESELQYVEVGMPVTIKLDAFPFRSWEGTITSVNPQAEILNDTSVFVAEVEITNDGDLKPGMQGAAKVSTHWSPLAWNLFHRPWESVRYWTVW